MSLFSLAEGRAPRSGRGGRRFKSCHSDQLIKHLAQPRKNRAQEIAQETYVLTSVIELAKRALLHCANHQSSMRPNWVRTRRQARQPAPSSAPRRPPGHPAASRRADRYVHRLTGWWLSSLRVGGSRRTSAISARSAALSKVSAGAPPARSSPPSRTAPPGGFTITRMSSRMARRLRTPINKVEATQPRY